MSGLLHAEVRTVGLNLSYFRLWLCKHKLIDSRTLSFCFVLTLKTRASALCSSIMGAFFGWNVGKTVGFLLQKCLHYGWQCFVLFF